MSQVVTLGDVVNQINDFSANYNTSNIDTGAKYRAANRAIEFVQRRLGLPSDKKIQSFYFYEDIKFYDCSDAFNELLKCYYNTSAIIDEDKNTPDNEWGVFTDTEILESTGRGLYRNRIAFTTINGKNQLLLDGHNFRGSNLIESFDSVPTTLTADFANTSVDQNIKKQGYGSFKFDLNTGSTSTITITKAMDISSQLQLNSAYRMYVYFPTGAPAKFTNVEIQLISSTGNYYSMTTTNQYDGTAWTTNAWSRLSWSLSAATTTGTPVATQITQVKVIFNHSGSFSAITNMRIDMLQEITPDYLDVVYYSAIKGTDTTGATSKIILDTASDIVSFGPFAPDLIYPIALKGATILWPQLFADPNFVSMYKSDFNEVMELYGRTYPRLRTVNSGQTKLKR